MLPGFNHNIKHKGKVYHIQTEDSGVKNPHIITHLFVGGNILASKKTTYSEIVGQEGFEKTVRSLMEEQHKQMLRNLINNVYDDVKTGNVHHLNGPKPLNTDGQPPSPSAQMMAAGGVPVETPKAVDVPNEVAAKSEEPVKKERGIFGEDLISEKSLDEVILSYLAEDLSDFD